MNKETGVISKVDGLISCIITTVEYKVSQVMPNTIKGTIK